VGLIIASALSTRRMTNCVLPLPVGPDTIAVNGCLNGNMVFLYSLFVIAVGDGYIYASLLLYNINNDIVIRIYFRHFICMHD